MNTLQNLVTSLLNIIGCAWNLLTIGFGWSQGRLSSINYRSLAVRTRNTGIFFLVLMCLAAYLMGFGLYKGYFVSPWYGFWLLVASAIIFLFILINIKVIMAALGMAIYLVRLAKAIIATPALFYLEQGGKLVWDLGTWPIDVSLDWVKKILIAIISILGGDELAKTLLEGKKPDQQTTTGSAWNEANQRFDEMYNGAKKTSSFSNLAFKYLFAFMGIVSLLNLIVGGPHDPYGPVAFLNNPKTFLGGLVIVGLITISIGTTEWQSMNQKNGGNNE